ncbi:MAG: ankyrin repeat domain-containing protein [Alphaproteobacteria bacterium]|nr:ankyrin repeat domain-containing protein [Alphaproteobacteria bacterium]
MSRTIKEKISNMKDKIIPHSLKNKVLGLAIFAAGGLAAGFAEKEHKAVEKYENQITQVLNAMNVKSIEDVNTPDKIFGQTALMKAKTPTEMKILIALGADVNATDERGRNAADYVLNNRYDYVKEDVKKKQKVTKTDGMYMVIEAHHLDGSISRTIGNLSRGGEELKKDTVIEVIDTEIKSVKRNTENAIKNDAECIALLLRSGIEIKQSYPYQEYDEDQKKILLKAGAITGKRDYINKVLEENRKIVEEVESRKSLMTDIRQSFCNEI